MDKKKLAITSIVLSVLSLLILLLTPAINYTVVIISCVICLIMSIIGIVCGFKAKEVKGLAITGIVIGFVAAALILLTTIGTIGYKAATDCVKKDEDYAVCKLEGQEFEIPITLLDESQFAK